MAGETLADRPVALEHHLADVAVARRLRPGLDRERQFFHLFLDEIVRRDLVERGEEVVGRCNLGEAVEEFGTVTFADPRDQRFLRGEMALFRLDVVRRW